MFLVILVNLTYALVTPLGKIALGYSSPVFLTAFRMILAGLAVLIYQYIYRRDKFTFKIENFSFLFLASFFTVYLTNVLEFDGLDYLTPSKTAFLYNLYPFASAIISYFFVKENLSFKKTLGLIIGFLGSLPLLLGDTAGETKMYKFLGFLSWPELAILGAVFACPFGWIFLQDAICKGKYDSVMANGVTMLGGGIMALGHSLITEKWAPLPITDYKYFIISSLVLMFMSNIVSNSLYIELLKKYSLTFLSFTAFATPLLTALFDWIIFGYTVSYPFYISTAIMFVGFYLFYQEELKKQKKF